MANQFLKPEIIAATALGLLEREITLPQLVWNDAISDFSGAKNDTVSIRVPSRLTAREYGWRNNRSSEIVLDELAESKVDVSLNHDIYSAVAVTDEELTLDITDFGTQVLAPQSSAVARAVEDLLATTIEGATYATTITINPADPFAAAVDARTALNKAEVPRDGRTLLVGADVEAAMLKSELLKRVDESGSDGALREALIGRYAGFNVYGSNAIDPGTAFAFVRSAFIFAMRAPAIPAGVSFGQSQSYKGMAMRWLRDYDPTRLRDRSVLNTYVGTAVVRDNTAATGSPEHLELVRAVKLVMPGSGS
ncbi:P22 phage major capsid protein family protein [Streptomyces noursei]|uniref:P22 phage major capsid protein family protein n=1 Tax=Streptomyces noursei TaxID=1971 RepID=UPI0023B845CA|nr:P22 phage major capsid protein family protein [Streptomyces noursei]